MKPNSRPIHRGGQKPLPRRTLLRGAGALLAAGVLARHGTQPRPAAAQGKTLPHRPNIVIILTDQERQPMHWPAGWAEANLPNRQRLTETGLSFSRAFCNSAMCSPSRSTLFTGLYPPQHGVLHTLTNGGTVSPTEPQLPPDGQNMAKMLASAGYNVHFRGKWHMSKGADGGDATSEDVAAYGFQGWSPPEAGQDTAPANFGGGCANHDARIAAEAVEFLNSIDPDSDTPFALIVSFANPHDLLAYPLTWDLEEEGGCDNYASVAPECFEQGIDLPPTHHEVLATNHKPTAQVQSRVLLAGLGPLVGPQQAMNYVNFYGYLQKIVDEHIGAVIDALEANGLRDNSLIIRTSDHGEMGLSHGGLRQKIFNVYEETLNIPLVISNPVLFPQAVRTDAMAALIDLMPTLATIADIPNPEQWTFMGNDLTPIILDAANNPSNPSVRVQDSVLFTFDDENCGAPDGQTIVKQPNHIRCIREQRWKYAMYFDPTGVAAPEFELYDLQEDPHELQNCANPLNEEVYNPKQQALMHEKLLSKLVATGTAPHNLRLPTVINSAT